MAGGVRFFTLRSALAAVTVAILSFLVAIVGRVQQSSACYGVMESS